MTQPTLTVGDCITCLLFELTRIPPKSELSTTHLHCLNDGLYTGPKFSQNMLDILLRFRLNKVALISDIVKAFLMISVADCDRYVLRFLWVKDVDSSESEIIVMLFTRVVFGVSASPFLLNATLDHHMTKFESVDLQFVNKFRCSVYVDDLASGAEDVDSVYDFYINIKAKLRLAEASSYLTPTLKSCDKRLLGMNSHHVMMHLQPTHDLR